LNKALLKGEDLQLIL